MSKSEANRAGDTSQRCGNSPAVFFSVASGPRKSPKKCLGGPSMTALRLAA